MWKRGRFVKHGGMLPKLNLISALAALVFFFLPWIDIECSGEKTATQTGFQTITGEATPTPQALAKNVRMDRSSEPLGRSYLAVFALVGIVSAVAIGFASLISAREGLAGTAALLCGLAFLCLAGQMLAGFPAEKAFIERLQEEQRPHAGQGSPLEQLGRDLGKQIAAEIKVRPTPWFYLCLGSLAVPVLLSLGSSMAGRKRTV